MTQMVAELYDALRAAGVAEQLATKADILELRAVIADTKAEIIKWNVATLGLMTAIYSGISIALRFVKP